MMQLFELIFAEPSFSVRLSGGHLSHEGRVEVSRYKNSGPYGTVCDDDWGLEEGHVVCISLGYSL